jgi:hypothetical protein
VAFALQERGVELTFADTVHLVDVCTVLLTPAHYTAINGSSDDDAAFDLDELCSAIFSGEPKPDWLEAGESLGEFEAGDCCGPPSPIRSLSGSGRQKADHN